MDSYSIGKLAAAARVPTSTIRYYERAGLLKPDFRTGSNYRGYTPRTLDKLRFIRSAQATGFSLKNVAEMLRLAFSSQPPCEAVESLMQKRLAEVRTQIRDLKIVERALTRSVRECCKGTSLDLCDEIGRLNGIPDLKKNCRTA